jgi:hypothetical protein
MVLDGELLQQGFRCFTGLEAAEAEVWGLFLVGRADMGQGDPVTTEIDTGLPIDANPLFQKGKQGEPPSCTL